ncbi:hypothetical protein GGR54DRAFT_602638 [Hypoxylon sp. NC1633]|nr:hypothetical protein GGR54DRAFT_602638 [Hypoxylon sp. NC1633]
MEMLGCIFPLSNALECDCSFTRRIGLPTLGIYTGVLYKSSLGLGGGRREHAKQERSCKPLVRGIHMAFLFCLVLLLEILFYTSKS